MNRIQVQTLLVQYLGLWLDKLHDYLHVKVFSISAHYVLVIDVAFDAQSLQNVPKVLLECLLTVFVGKQNTCFCLLRLPPLK